MKLLVATTSEYKVKEIRSILSDSELDLISLSQIAPVAAPLETGSTFEENARLKATCYRETTGYASLADDSGLEVDSLSGEPGVRSARYGGDSCTSDQDRVNLLLKNLENVPWEERGARFRCVIAVAQPRKSHQPTLVTQAEGSVAGMIQYNPQGDAGFGYDPVFYVPSYDKTVAQLPLDVKNKISHRANAVQKALETLK